MTFPLSFCIIIVSLEAGIWSVRAIPVQCNMTNNKVSEAGRWPDTVGTYHNDSDWTELRYYRLRCELTRAARGEVFRVYHDHWKRPFEKVDCERSGCVPVIWNIFSGAQPIIDVYWSSVIKFVTTASQLKICQVDAINPNSTIFTTSQLNDMNICQTSGRFSAFGSVTSSRTVVKDYFVHVSSDMFSEEEIERINNGENVVATIDKDCSAGYKFRDGCDIMIVSSPFTHCSIWIDNNYYNALPHAGLELTELHDNTNGLIAYKYRMTAYKFYHYIYSNIPGGEFINTLPRRRLHEPVRFLVGCTNEILKSPFRERIRKRFTIVTLFWPSSTIINRNEGETGLDLSSTNGQESVIDVLIVTAANVTSFLVNRAHIHEVDGEFVIRPRLHYPYNHTTVYSIVIPKPLNHEGYKITYRLAEVDLNFTITFYLTIRRAIDMVISPMKIVVVRGDRSVRPYYVCLATSSAPKGHLEITWSKEIGPLRGVPAPLQAGDFERRFEGSYLRFPSGATLTTDYSGEYTCTASYPYLSTQKVTAIFVVLEPGSYYSIFRPHWVPIYLPLNDVVITDEEQALFPCIDRPVITEPGKLSCTNATAEGNEGGGLQILPMVSGIIVGIAAVLLAVVIIYRWYRRRMLVREDASSDGEVDITSSSESLAADSDDDGSSTRLVNSSSSNELKLD